MAPVRILVGWIAFLRGLVTSELTDLGVSVNCAEIPSPFDHDLFRLDPPH